MKSFNKYIRILIAISTLSLMACSDSFLQKDSLTSVSSSTFWQTKTDALNGLAACYDGLQNKYLYNGGPWNCGPLNMDCMTDNGGHFNWSGWMAGYDICNGIHTASSGLVGEYWKACYEEIKRCNTLIFNIDRAEMSENDIAMYKAEAITMRAMMYTNLTMTYQDVPYLTEVQSLTDAECAKTDRATIVAALMTDLKDVVDALPVTPSARGRITKGAALSVLGRIALYNEKWDEAISAYQKVIGLKVYELFPDYTDLFTQENEGCSEIILGIRYEGPGSEEGSSIGGHWDAPLEAMNGTLDLSGEYYCTDGLPTTQSSLYKEGSVNTMNSPDPLRYMNRDPRLKATLFVPGMTWGTRTAQFYGGSAASYSTLYVIKYFNPSLNWSSSWDDGQDFYVIRYAEVLLSLAEALVEKGGYTYSEVTSLINQVRARAGLPSVEKIEGSSLDQDGLRKVIRHERRVETAFEGLRLFDLYRWKELQNAVDKINAEASANGFWYEKRNYRGEMEYEWPIPLHEIDSNSKLEQNELWK